MLHENEFDIVITWVDWSNKNFVKKMIEAGGRSEGCESGEFLELKYLLRSLKKHKVGYRHIYIVHSDNHPPPKYLSKNQSDLFLIKHSEIVRDSSHLPLIHRESIVSHLYRIPGLHRYFFYIQDDIFINNKAIFDEMIANYRNKKINTHRCKLNLEYDVTKPCGLWYQGTVNSARIVLNENFNEKINTGNYSFITFKHGIQFFDQSILTQIEKLYPLEFIETATYKDQANEKHKEKSIFCLTCIFINYLIYKMDFTELAYPENYNKEIHTNGYANKLNNAILTEFHNNLQNSQCYCSFNVQGDGASDEYPRCQPIHDIFYSYLNKLYPIKTTYEK